MSDIAIRVENLGKQYRIGSSGSEARFHYRSLRDSIADLVIRPFRHLRSGIGWKYPGKDERENTIWALRNVSFEVEHGEVVGIIGRNGAGKTTLLKVLSRITEPTEGYAQIYGRVGSLLEVDTGFHPELTGRENIYLNGAILGMKKAEIKRKFDEIVAFAEVEKFIDTPVKHYSSGMYVRLAFAVAAHLEPEILLVDEVLAVGDLAFQEKCLGKMSDVAHGGRTVLFVSHNMAAIANLCTKAYLLERGQIVTSGLAQQVIERYLETTRTLSFTSLRERQDRKGDGRLRFTDVFVQDSTGNPVEVVVSGQDIALSLGYQARDNRPLRNVSVSIAFYGMFGQFLLMCWTSMTGADFKSLPPEGRIVCCIPSLPFAPGRYEFNLYSEVNGVLADWIKQASQLIIAEGDFFGTGKLPPASHGGFLTHHTWRVEPPRP